MCPDLGLDILQGHLQSVLMGAKRQHTDADDEAVVERHPGRSPRRGHTIIDSLEVRPCEDPTALRDAASPQDEPDLTVRQLYPGDPTVVEAAAARVEQVG